MRKGGDARNATFPRVTATVAFLDSNTAGLVDGENIHIDGAWYIG